MKVKESTKRRRFLKLIKKFRELPEERFDIESWVRTEEAEDLRLPSNFLTKNHCGTTGCLAGWAVAWFPRSWEYGSYGAPLLKKYTCGITAAHNMSEFFGGKEDDWANIIYLGYYSKEEGCYEWSGVPKHLVMGRLLELYGRIYYKKS